MILLLIVVSLPIAGCTTRSISDSAYQRGRNWYYRYNDSQYQGELNELSVLGVSTHDSPTEADIHAALSNSGKVLLNQGDPVILIQSGAMFPDDPMLSEMQKYFTVIPLSGIPEQPATPQVTPENPPQPASSLNKVLRLAAARSGAKTLIVYWGILETAQKNQVTKTVSWVPILGSLIPDEVQQMRIRLKAVIIDVAAGNWTMLTPQAFSDTRFSARPSLPMWVRHGVVLILV